MANSQAQPMPFNQNLFYQGPPMAYSPSVQYPIMVCNQVPHTQVQLSEILVYLLIQKVVIKTTLIIHFDQTLAVS